MGCGFYSVDGKRLCHFYLHLKHWIGLMTGYALKDHIWIFGKGPMFFFCQCLHPKCLWPHPASYPMGTWSSVQGEKATGAWSRRPAFI